MEEDEEKSDDSSNHHGSIVRERLGGIRWPNPIVPKLH